MPGLLSISSILMAAAVAGSASAQAAPPPGAIDFPENHVTRHVDCEGRNLSVSGSDDVLDITGCGVINVVGSRDRIQVKLLPTSTIAALGDDNHIVFQHSPGVEARVSSSGSGNEIVPQMSAKDSRPAPPVGSPAAPR